MADWLLGIKDWNLSNDIVLRPPDLDFTLNLKEPSEIHCEFALSQFTTLDPWAPKRSDWYLLRDGNQIIEGIVSSRNLSKDRDTILFGGKCYLWYLQSRIYPFHPVFSFGDWPKKWTNQDLTVITEDMLQAMLDEEPTYTIPLVFSNSNTGVTTNYAIDAGDGTNILDHIRKHSDRDDGFDFRLRPDGSNLRFSMQTPDNLAATPIYTLDKNNSQLLDFDWTDEGAEATWTLGLGAGSTQKRGSESTYGPSVVAYRRWDKVQDFGEVRNQDALDKLTAAQGYQDRFPKKQLTCRILADPTNLQNLYATSLGRPYSILGNRVHAEHDFGIHHVNADFRVLNLHFTVDRAGNEAVEFGLNMIN